MNLEFKSNTHLKRLDNILNFRIDKLFSSSSYLFTDIVASLGLLVAIIFTPVVLWSLFKLKKHAWLISFTVFILLPLFGVQYFAGNSEWYSVLILLPLLFLIIYYLFLRHNLHNWKEPVFSNAPGSDF